MEKLRFEMQRGLQVDTRKTKPVDEALVIANELYVSEQLKGFITDINKEKGYILVTIEQDGVTMKNAVKIKEPLLWGQIIDKLYPDSFR